MRHWKLAETNYGHVKGQHYEVAVLPLGATEPHNLHLPYGTDAFEGETVGEHICQAAYDRGAKVILLPTIPYGTETNQMEFPLAMNLNPSTLQAVIKDLVASLARHGIHKLVLLNSHGGNDLKPVLRELYGCTPVQTVSVQLVSRAELTSNGKYSSSGTITRAKWKPRSAWRSFRNWWLASPMVAWRRTTASSGRRDSRR